MERWRKPWREQDPRTKHWFLRWRERSADGKLRKKSLLCESYTDAGDQVDAKIEELKRSRNTSVNPNAGLLDLFNSYILDCERVRQLRPGAVKAKRLAIERFVKVLRTVGEITRDSIIKYRDDLFDSLEPVTVGIRLREIKAFVRWLWFEGKLSTNPFVRIEMPRCDPTPRFLTDEELGRLEVSCTGQLKTIVRMAYLTGMRQNEILTAKWEDIAWVKVKGKSRAFITIWATTAKNRRSRVIPLRSEVTALLGSRGKGPIFKDWDRWNLRWAWSVARAKAQFKGRVRFHDLRHTFCRIYLQGGGTIADLMTLTGHQSLKMMEVYAHFESKYTLERMDAINLPPELFHRATTGRTQDTEGKLEVIEGDMPTHEETKKADDDDDNSARSTAVLK